MDSRRRRYVPLSIHFAGGRTGQRLLDEFGLEGLAVWACLLAAAKRSRRQGTLEWYSDNDAWVHLGIASTPPSGFTFTQFAKFLGRLKQARTTTYGQVKETTLTQWEQWNNTIKTEHDAEKKRRKRAQNTGDKEAPVGGTEVEGEGETPLPPIRRRSRAPQTQNGHIHACPKCGAVQRNASELEDHLEYVHPTPAEILDDLPL
jgi:hypothetical protein